VEAAMKMTGEAVVRRVEALFAACAIACLASQARAQNSIGPTNLPAQSLGLGQSSPNRPSLHLGAVPTAAAAMLGSMASSQSLTNSPPAGLIVWWLFDEGTGTTVQDASGNGNSGTLFGDPPPAAPMAGAQCSG